MSDHAEVERLEQDELRSSLPNAKWDFALDLGADPGETWQRIRGVVESLAAYSYDNWPDDEYWNEVLPEWLASFMMTEEQTKAVLAKTPREHWDDLPWDFRSWLDAIRERDWRWWGGERSENRARIVLEVTGIPPRIDAFKQILLAAGAQILSEEHD